MLTNCQMKNQPHWKEKFPIQKLRTPLKNNKSPGLDGFTVEFFKLFWVDIWGFILRSINYGYRNGSLSFTQKQGLITCLPKPNNQG